MEIPQDQSAYWDRAAPIKRFTHPWLEGFVGGVLPRSASVLDLGCGQGRIMEQLHQRGHPFCFGIDSSGQMLRRVPDRISEGRLVRGRGTQLPFATGVFGGVTLFSVLTCLPRLGDQERLFEEILRVLRPGGVLVISDLLRQRDDRNHARYADGLVRYGQRGVFRLPEGVVLTHPDRGRIEELLSSFELVRMKTLEVKTMNGNTADAFQALARHPL